MAAGFECPETAVSSWSPEYQWNLSREGCVKFDADAVGIGVIAAFIISGGILLIALTVGCITKSFDDNIFDEADHALARDYQRLLPDSRWFSDDKALRDDRVEAFTQFLLSLGDQQMVTALALLIAVFKMRNGIILYSVNVAGLVVFLSSVLSLAVLPTVTTRDRNKYLDALDVLKKSSPGPLQQTNTTPTSKSPKRLHSWAKHLRFGIVFVSFIGMAYLWILGMGSRYYPQPGRSDLYFLPNANALKVDLKRVLSNVIWTYVLVGFIWSLLDASCCFYTTDPFVVDWIIRRWSRRWNLQEPSGYGDPPDWIPLAKEYAQGRSRSMRYSVFGLRHKLIEESYAFCALHNSFCSWGLISAISEFALSTGELLVARGGPDATIGITGDRDAWGFGQIVPMLLLVLPLLGAIEAYDTLGHKVHNRKMRYTPTGEFLELQNLERNPSALSAPNTGAPNTGAPNTGIPNTGAPNTSAPNTGAPNTGAPNTKLDKIGQSLIRWDNHDFRWDGTYTHSEPCNNSAILTKIHLHLWLELVIQVTFGVTLILEPLTYSSTNWDRHPLIVISRLTFGCSVATDFRHHYCKAMALLFERTAPRQEKHRAQLWKPPTRAFKILAGFGEWLGSSLFVWTLRMSLFVGALIYWRLDDNFTRLQLLYIATGQLLVGCVWVGIAFMGREISPPGA